MNDQFETPILFLIFNRPDTTAKVFERIRQIQPSKLYIAADGPRPDRTDDAVKCQLTREVVKNIDWPCHVKNLFRDKNLGCRDGVSSAINWFFENEEAGIILEDDCLPDLTFFPFCAELLKKYQHNNKIAMVSGDNFQHGHKRGNGSYYFSRFPYIWGWATWKRAWQKYDPDMADWPKLKEQGWLNEKYHYKTSIKYISKEYDAAYQRKLNSWGYRWHYTILKNKQLTVVPNQNLVTNIGATDDSTHGAAKHSPNTFLETMPMQFPLKHPREIKVNLEAIKYFELHSIVLLQYKAILYKSIIKLALGIVKK